MVAQGIGWLLRGRRKRAVVAIFGLVVVLAVVGVWRVAGWGPREAIVTKDGPVEIGTGTVRVGSGGSLDECLRTVVPWGPRFDYDFVAWRPDGSAIYFTDRGQIIGITADGSRLWPIASARSADADDYRSIAGAPMSFAPAPDGFNVVFAACPSFPVEVRSGDGNEARAVDHRFDLFRVSHDGTDLKRLTTSRDVDFYPVWSPDGKRIAFLFDAGAERLGMGLNTMAPDGTDVQRLLDEEFAVLHQPPQWSPDGRHLAVVRYFAHRRVGTGYSMQFEQIDRELYVVGADGAKRWRLATDVVSGPSWSPDGQRLAYARANADGVALYTVRIDGRDETRVGDIPNWREPDRSASNPEAPAEAWIETVAWSPDGTRILVRSNPDHPSFVVRLESGRTTQLRIVSDGNPDTFVREVLAAAWSADGTHIALVGRKSRHSPGPDIVGTMTADGADVLVLADKEESAPWQPVQPNVADAAACRAGVVVPDPDANPELVTDCVALVEFHQALDRRSRPNWSADHRIDDWQGVSVGGTPRRVEALALPSLSMEARLPDALGTLTGLRTLDLSDNHFWDRIPAALGSLSQLEHLNLGLNPLMGPIPPELDQLTKLRTLDLAHTRLNGEIPQALAELPNLQEIVLAGNQFTGCVPPGLPLRDRDELDLPTCEAAT